MSDGGYLEDPCATIEGMAENVLARAPARFALAGLSMGGYVALAFAAPALRSSSGRV